MCWIASQCLLSTSVYDLSWLIKRDEKGYIPKKGLFLQRMNES